MLNAQYKNTTKRRFGKICAKHPALMGERYALNRTCVACAREHSRRVILTSEQITRQAAYQKRWRQANPAKFAAYVKRWKQANPAKRAAYQRTSWLKRKYGLTQDDYAALLAKQSHLCKICLTSKPGKSGWAIDHNHKTGNVRGILCQACNTALGLLKESSTIMTAAMAYLAAEFEKQ